MTAALLAFLAAALAGTGARDQLLVAQLASAGARRAIVPVLAMAAALLATAAAVWIALAAAGLGAALVRELLVALTVALAGCELILVRPRPAPAEPTQSLGALSVILLADQLGDGARLLVGAVALATAAPLAAGLGGGMGALLAILAGWLGAGQLVALRLERMRRALGLALLALAALLAVLALQGAACCSG